MNEDIGDIAIRRFRFKLEMIKTCAYIKLKGKTISLLLSQQSAKGRLMSGRQHNILQYIGRTL